MKKIDPIFFCFKCASLNIKLNNDRCKKCGNKKEDLFDIGVLDLGYYGNFLKPNKEMKQEIRELLQLLVIRRRGKRR